MTEFEIRWSGGSLDLLGWNDGNYQIYATADGVDFGNPEPVRNVVRSALLDGSALVKERDDNRTVTLELVVLAPDSLGLAEGEQALSLLDGRRCELVWTPPDGFAAATVFVVVAADLRQSKKLSEELALLRRYTLTLECLPYAYADEWLEVEALPTGVATPVLVDNCDTLTGWAAFAGASLVDGGDFVQVINSGVARRTGAVDLTTARYLACEYAGTPPRLLEVVAASTGKYVQLDPIARDGRFTLYDVGIAITEIAFWFDDGATKPGEESGRIVTINKQSAPRTAAANGQTRTVVVPGSRRTPATLKLDAGSGTLGWSVVYSGPDYDPAMVNRLPAGVTAHEVSATPLRYIMPIRELPPGEYVVWAEMDGVDNNVVLDVTAELRSGSTILDEASIATLTPISALEKWGGGPLPRFHAELPGWSVADDSTLDFGLRITRTAGTETIQIPWLWLFNITTGRLCVVNGGLRKKVWLELATLTRDHPTIWRGNAELSTAVPLSLDADIRAWDGGVNLTPPVSSIYTWSKNAASQATALFRPAGHTHIGG